MVSGASHGFWLERGQQEQCDSQHASLQDNTAHSNSIAGFLVTAPACAAANLPSVSFDSLTAYKHRGSGVLIDNLQSASLQDSLFADNLRSVMNSRLRQYVLLLFNPVCLSFKVLALMIHC